MSFHVQPGTASSSADQAERAREIAIRILTHSQKSSEQLRQGLLSREVDPGIAQQVIERYIEVGLLDDLSLARAIVRTRHKERGQSRRAISFELRRKGFAPEDMEDALAQVSDQSEGEAALALAAKKWRSLGSVARDVRRRRIVGMLGRKGYSSSVAYSIMKTLEDADTREGSIGTND